MSYQKLIQQEDAQHLSKRVGNKTLTYGTERKKIPYASHEFYFILV